jgi:hypothetical protein
MNRAFASERENDLQGLMLAPVDWVPSSGEDAGQLSFMLVTETIILLSFTFL